MNITPIAWTTFTWNVWSGCQRIAEECRYCYAERFAENKRGTRAFPNGFARTVRLHKLNEPYKLKEPALIFVDSTSDFFWEEVDDELRDRVVDVIESTPQHQYQVLTKRPRRMLEYSRRRRLPANFWAGVSIGTHRTLWFADVLREVDAEIRFISAEPLLEPIAEQLDLSGVHWVIAGGESGVHLWNHEIRQNRALVDYENRTWIPRLSRIPWVRTLRDRCTSSGTKFFHKQWGGPTPCSAGRILDGRTWYELPRLPGER